MLFEAIGTLNKNNIIMIVIYQPVPPMEFIFHNSYATLDLAFCNQTFYVIVF
jgi:hypothetical protein